MNFQVDPQHLIILDRCLFRPLKEKYKARVWIFGSRARGDSRAFSDLDVLYELTSPLPSGALSKIREDLEESRLPFKVDLVELSALAESYRDQVLKERVPI